MTDYRAVFDADVTFANGGGLQTQGFRMDVPGPDVTEAELGELFIRHLGLLMVDRVRLTGVRLVAEPHKGSRGVARDGGMPDGGAPVGQTRLVELNHVVAAGMTTYAGLPGPEITPHLAGLPLDRVADLPALVVRVTDAGRAIDRPVLAALDVAGAAVLLHTGWDRHWGTTTYGQDAPYLTGAAARLLADGGARLVGIDSVNIDNTDDERPARSVLLAAGIPVLEHLTGLEQVPTTGARLHAAPVRVRDFSTFPVRAYAVIPEPEPIGQPRI